MDKWIEAIANGDFSAILSLITTLLSGTFGTILVVVATKFLGYKKSVSSIVEKVEKVVEEKVIPEVKSVGNDIKVELFDAMRGDIKVLAESMALLTNNDPSAKIAIIENVSKIGASKEVVEVAKSNVEAEIKAEEEHREAIQETIRTLEENQIETL